MRDVPNRRSGQGHRIGAWHRVLAAAGLLCGVVPGLIVVSAGPAAATAQLFTVALSGAEEVPANASTASGTGSVALNAAETMIAVELSWAGLSGNANGAHIHGFAGPGVNAGVLFGLAGVPSATSGSVPAQSFAITAAQVTQLKAGQMYFNIHSTVLPGGEIRAQITTTKFYPVTLTGGQEVPANASGATGTGSVRLNGAETMIAVSLSWSGLSSNANGAHIHGPAGPGVNAGVLFGLSGVPPAASGSVPTQNFAITAAQVTQLKSGQMYFNVHSTIFPGGEIRAQIVDIVKATCSYTIVSGPPKRVDFTVSDAGGGMSTIQVTVADNVVMSGASVPTPGTNAPLTFTATKVDQSMPARVAIVLTDMAGNQSSCI